jgi:hypothetical protein
LNTLTFSVFLGASRPVKRMCRYLNNSNGLDLEHHLQYWLTFVIYSIGLIITYIYFSNTDDFSPNTNRKIKFPEGWEGNTQSSTVTFISFNIMYIFLPFSIYQSSPWKLSIWKNWPLAILIIANIVLLVPISFMTDRMEILGMKAVGTVEIIVIWIIMLVTTAGSIAFNKYIERYYFQRQKKAIEEINQN